MATDTLGRELIELVQIDQDFCNNTYGVAPCTASGDPSLKCFNTFKTCQDTENYDKGIKTITFKKNQCGGVEEYSIPILKGFSVTIPEINIFSRDTKNKQLGRFGSCSVSFNDVQFSDNHLDPYVSERDYNPLEQGTFWTKFLARNPYYEGWKIRLYDGQVGQTLAEMNVREYELEKISNPDSNGNVTVKATDLMRRLDKSKAIYPPTSSCRLISDVNLGDTSFTTQGGLAPYSTPVFANKYFSLSGDPDKIRLISSETDNGDGTFTYTYSGNVEASAGDAVENAVFIQSQSIAPVYTFFLQQVFSSSEADFTDILTRLQVELGTDYGDVSNFIEFPTPINEILSDLNFQCGIYTWYDDVTKMIDVGIVGDIDYVPIELNQNNNLIADRTSSKTVNEDRISEIYIRYDQLQFIGRFPYQKILLQVDIDAESPEEYNGKTTLEMSANWLIGDASASNTAQRMLTMFRDSTRTISFELDIKDNISIGEVFKLAWRGYTDIYGNDEVINWICTGRTRMGDRLKIKAQEFKFNVAEV